MLHFEIHFYATFVPLDWGVQLHCLNTKDASDLLWSTTGQALSMGAALGMVFALTQVGPMALLSSRVPLSPYVALREQVNVWLFYSHCSS